MEIQEFLAIVGIVIPLCLLIWGLVFVLLLNLLEVLGFNLVEYIRRKLGKE